MRCLKLCESVPDLFKAKICEISYEMVAKECLRNQHSIWIYNFSETSTFKMYIEIAFSKFDPS